MKTAEQVMRVGVVVVTYNRAELLFSCLNALVHQTRTPDLIIVIDNASSDGTAERFRQPKWNSNPTLTYIRLSENLGGAGGFEQGLRHAVAAGVEWVWLMDDDALPELTALERLLQSAKDPLTLYGSTPVNGDMLCWPMALLGGESTDLVRTYVELPELAAVRFLPFLGFFISIHLINKIGFPDGGFFLAADDVEYCARASKIGSKAVMVRDSRLLHPLANTYPISAFGLKIYSLKLPPWKRYYDTRNRLLVARKHHGVALFTKTIPGSFLRLYGTLRYEPQKAAQFWAFVAGFVDGIAGKKGRRHEKWGI